MTNLLVLALCFGAGIVLRATRKLPDSAPAALNAVIITICLPAVALLHLHRAALGRDAVFPILMPWLFFLLAAAIFFGLSRFRGWSRETLGALVLTGGFGNTSFVGFPLVEAIYGPQALATAVLVDQPGSFLALGTLGIASASLCGARRARSGAFKRVVLFPPFLGLVAALALRPVEFPPWLIEALEKLASPLTPLAMLSIGAQLRFNRRALLACLEPLAFGLAVKLFFAPLAMLALAAVLGLNGEAAKVTLLEAAMAPMITGAILADEFGLDTELANLMVSIGIPISLASVPLWARLLGVVL